MGRYRFTKEVQTAYERLKQPFAIYQLVDNKVVTLVVSDGFCEMRGYDDRAEAMYDMDHDMYKYVHPDDAVRIQEKAMRFASEDEKYDVLYRTRTKNEPVYKVIHCIGKHVMTETGVRLAHIWYTVEGNYSDEPQENESYLNIAMSNVLHEKSIMKAKDYDSLTGLPSMTYFFELAETGKAAFLKEGAYPVFLFFDMSGMKLYNRKYGFAEGDNLIKAFSQVLVDIFGHGNCCHMGGDQFAVFAKEDGIEDTLNTLFNNWHGRSDINSLPVRVGIYSNRMEDVPVSTACDRAKMACDSIRTNYVSGFAYYSEALNASLEMREYILSNIDKAIENGWIKAYYQPIVRAVNGRVCDEEALARWIDPERGFLSPADFIPYLEEAGQLYKLDLHILDRVLKKIQIFKEEGIHIVPQSINLSRSDFNACDIVEEIRERVDAADVSRDLITIEITESTIGKDFEFIKEQIERFQELGFPVWMDDFGSGYSSLDVLQSIRFNLIKFDMSFMKRLDEGASGKIILTDLMKMATSLGVDTVCEGVETEEQVRFLQIIGCSKLQGYYYSKPVPLEQILERYRTGIQIGFENPEEASYFAKMGRINLYDLSFLANKDEDILRNTFDTLPMGVMEVNYEGTQVQFIRSNESFRSFMKRAFGFNIVERPGPYDTPEEGPGAVLMEKVKQTREQASRIFVEEKVADGSIVHSFIRRIGVNPVTGETSVAIAVLSIAEPNDGTTYASIARALAADYYNLFYVDMNTEEYIEYSSSTGKEEIAVERRGKEFFNDARTNTMSRIYKKDRKAFLSSFSKENIIRELKEQGVFIITYRLIENGSPIYVRMKIMPMEKEINHIIIGISIIDTQMKKQEEERRNQQERITLGRIAALSANYIVLYTVNLETGSYIQYNPSSVYESFGLAKQGEDFFADVIKDAPKAIDPKDIERHLGVLTKENVLKEIEEKGIFVHNYGLLIDGESVPVSLRANMVEEDDEKKLLLGVSIV